MATVSHALLVFTGGFAEFAAAYPSLIEVEEAVAVPPMLSSLRTMNAPRDSPNKVKITNLEPTLIIPGLYLGARKDALSIETLKKLGVTCIVNVTKDIPCAFPETIEYEQIPVDVRVYSG